MENKEKYQSSDNNINDTPNVDTNDAIDAVDDTIPALSYESDEEDIELSPDDKKKFESFIESYHSFIESALKEAKNNHQAEEIIAEAPIQEDIPTYETEIEEDINDISSKVEACDNVPPPRVVIEDCEKKEEPARDKDSWCEDITLIPESYDDVSDTDTETPEEENDFNDEDVGIEIGKLVTDDDFQLTIDFDADGTVVPHESEDDTPRKYDQDKPRFIDTVFDVVEIFVLTFIAVIILTSFLFKHTVVEGSSMNSTLEDGEHLIIVNLFYTPQRGDIIVFEDYSTFLKKPVVKRVIALPGEEVEVKINAETDACEVYINGELLEEDYALNVPRESTPNVGKWTVAEGEVFVLGDNRYNSTDSRDNRVGTISTDCILGKVVLRFFPFDKFTTDFN